MNRRFHLASLALALSLAGLAGVARAAQSYEMVCRGGGPSTLGLNLDRHSVLYYNQKNPRLIGQGIDPGACVWLDRVIAPSEPPCIEKQGVTGAAWLWTASTGSQGYIASPEAPWMRKLTDPNQYVSLFVYNPGDGCFLVTGFRP